jgi:hypothetical protein
MRPRVKAQTDGEAQRESKCVGRLCDEVVNRILIYARAARTNAKTEAREMEMAARLQTRLLLIGSNVTMPRLAMVEHRHHRNAETAGRNDGRRAAWHRFWLAPKISASDKSVGSPLTDVTDFHFGMTIDRKVRGTAK